jgi:hypothetical protein
LDVPLLLEDEALAPTAFVLPHQLAILDETTSVKSFAFTPLLKVDKPTPIPSAT